MLFCSYYLFRYLMATIPKSDDSVAVKVHLPRQLDRAMEIAVAHMDSSKRKFIEDAVREKLAREGREVAAA